jgi:hypothetical protein
VLDAFTVILFVQVFMAVDAKRKKYFRELLKTEDMKKPKATPAPLEAKAKVEKEKPVLEEPSSSD